MTVDLTPRVIAPSFADDPLAYVRWHLERHPEMYREFRKHADLYRAVDATRRVSADMICHVLRYHTGQHAGDDQFSVNNVLTPLYARLYRRERPEANMPTRGSVLDALTDAEWAELLDLTREDRHA